jgi:nucleotide-binding universal stress UspA family protein
MIRRILLPVDASEHSSAAARWAEELALRHKATIYALGVVDVPGIERDSCAGAGASHYAKDMRERRLDDARKVLGGFLDNLAADMESRNVNVVCVNDAGPVHEVIAERARTADIVVVAEGINFQFETSSKPGDTLFKLLEITSRLVMVVPSTAPRPIRQLLLAHDLSNTCAKVLYMMAHMRPFPESQWIVVHADDEGTYDEEDFDDSVEYLREHHIQAEMVVRNLVPSKAILDVAAERKVDAIVLGAYDAGKVRRFLFGSTAQKILDNCDIPLIFGV